MPGPDVNIRTTVGEARAAAGTNPSVRGGPYGELIVNDSGLGRYFEVNRLGRLFVLKGAASGFTIANATFTTPLAATSTPIIGLYNPSGSQKAAVILKAAITVTPAGPATTTLDPVWVGATPNAGITASPNASYASARFDVAAATQMFGFSNTALTGLVGGTIVTNGLGPFGTSVSGTSGALTTSTVIADEVAGALIVVPGAFLGVLAAVLPAVASATGAIWYAEIDWPL